MAFDGMIEGLIWPNIAAWGYAFLSYAKFTKKRYWLFLGSVMIGGSFFMLAVHESMNGILEPVVLMAIGCGVGFWVNKKGGTGDLYSYFFFILPFHLFSIAVGLWFIGEHFWGGLIGVVAFFFPSMDFKSFVGTICESSDTQ